MTAVLFHVDWNSNKITKEARRVAAKEVSIKEVLANGFNINQFLEEIWFHSNNIHSSWASNDSGFWTHVYTPSHPIGNRSSQTDDFVLIVDDLNKIEPNRGVVHLIESFGWAEIPVEEVWKFINRD